MSSWLARGSTNRDAILVGIAIPVVFAILDATGVFETLPWWAWLAILGALVVLWAAYALGRRVALRAIDEEQSYAEHISDALTTMEKVLSGQIKEELRVGDFIREGIFEPAHALLTRGVERGDVRLSVLEPDGEEFRMTLALGHSLQGRRDFRLRIDDSFAGIAYRRGEIVLSDDTDADDRFKTHPKAKPERGYRSIVAVPLDGDKETYGVLVAVATEPNAFSTTDRAYVQVLAALVSLARVLRHSGDGQN